MKVFALYDPKHCRTQNRTTSCALQHQSSSRALKSRHIIPFFSQMLLMVFIFKHIIKVEHFPPVIVISFYMIKPEDLFRTFCGLVT